MSFHHSPRIVTDGLVLCLDAANPKSYPGSGTVWTDLVAGNNGTLTNGPTFNSNNGGNIVFNSTNQSYITVSGSITLSNATFLAWIRRSGTQNNRTGILFSRKADQTVATGIGFGNSTIGFNALSYTWNDQSNTFGFNAGLTTPDNEWIMVAVSVIPTSATVYLAQVSGMTQGTNNVSHPSLTIDAIRVGSDSNQTTRNFNGNIAQACIYNTALTPDQILQNYNNTKSRFQL